MDTRKAVNKYLKRQYGHAATRPQTAPRGYVDRPPSPLTQALREERARAEAERQAAIAAEDARIEGIRQLKAQKRGEWLAAGGDERSFEANWPELHRQILLRRTLGDE